MYALTQILILGFIYGISNEMVYRYEVEVAVLRRKNAIEIMPFLKILEKMDSSHKNGLKMC